jgi:ComF family protein
LQLLAAESNEPVEKVNFLIESETVSYSKSCGMVHAFKRLTGNRMAMSRIGLGSGSENLCPPCAADLPRTGHACGKCGLPLALPADHFCGACLSANPPWDDAIAALLYRFPVDQLVCRFKFGRNLACGEVLAWELVRAVREKGEQMPACMIPVPLHRTRLFSRTFNQAELLGRQLGKSLGIPVHGHALQRIHQTRAQSGLDAADRRRNIKGAFRCRRTRSGSAGFDHVALVDDVMTTGATLAECTRVLVRAGAGRVSAWVAARAPAS